ncbi:uncharacterized protein EDB91DRAFT_1258815 [Suillus paluster]|uniref:uncharacterized protein n=1 Tax=Suillus paluster TaxID=48578 RepID=UPI001B872608|nr:uncharacterized protein EDB91DRAFT_1258815 [Suillus paluster]KAG1718177.1 hypothetical protein EDB91DRAFT_1258815 [Suillus paluster]
MSPLITFKNIDFNTNHMNFWHSVLNFQFKSSLFPLFAVSLNFASAIFQDQSFSTSTAALSPARSRPLSSTSQYCTDNTTCSIDWRQLWWNSMARFLVDGRNPQDFRDAVERFQELGFEIGRVNPECWKTLLQTVKKGAAFHLAFDLIEETAQQLSAALITEPGPMLTRAELDTLGHQ